MKVKCEYVVACGNYKCAYNNFSKCIKNVIALDANGQCALCKLKPEPISKDRPAQNKD